MSKLDVLKCSSDFFHSWVKESLKKTGVQVSLPVKNYLCELLQFYVVSDHLFTVNSSGKKQLKPLAELYLNSHHSDLSRSSHLKKMGDTSLYISGFFRESLKKRMVSVDYYINMGREAYRSLSVFQNKEVFEELAVRFSDLVFVLFQMREENSSKKDLLSLLDQYMETGSQGTARDIIKKGINIPFKKSWKKHSH